MKIEPIPKREFFVDTTRELEKCHAETTPTRHRLIHDQWLEIKRVLDLSYKKLSPLIPGEQSIIFRKFEFGRIGVDTDKTFFPLMGMLQEIGVVTKIGGYQTRHSPRVLMIGIFVNGEVAVKIKSLEDFEKQHIAISNLYNQILEDGRRRFPENYGVARSFPEIFAQMHQPSAPSYVKSQIGSVVFIEQPPSLKIEGITVSLPPHKNEHWLCKAIYSPDIKVGEVVDWSIIYEKITGYESEYFGKPAKTREHWRVVYDAVEALNNRVMEKLQTKDKVLTWQDKTVRKNF